MKNVKTLVELQKLNPEMSTQDILEREQLIYPRMDINRSVFQKSSDEKKLLKSMKKYHHKFGEKLNSQAAKHAFFMESRALRKNKNFTFVTV